MPSVALRMHVPKEEIVEEKEELIRLFLREEGEGKCRIGKKGRRKLGGKQFFGWGGRSSLTIKCRIRAGQQIAPQTTFLFTPQLFGIWFKNTYLCRGFPEREQDYTAP